MGMQWKPKTKAQHEASMIQAQPSGLAWPRDVLTRFGRVVISPLASELSRYFDLDVVRMWDEADPRTASQTLDAWERERGLPEPCDANPPTTDDGRRKAITAKVLSRRRGGQTLDHYRRLAEAAGGSNITVTDNASDVLHLDEPMDQPMVGWQAAFMFTVSGNHNGFESEIRCAVNRDKPAHTVAIFDLI